MDKRANSISQIYLLSLDTFMIMTVMGITLGIIFFILNPTLNSGITVKDGKLEFKLGNIKFARAKNVLLIRHECDIEESEYCSKIFKNGNELQIVLENKLSPVSLVFKLYNNENILIEKKSIIEQAIQEIGLSFILID